MRHWKLLAAVALVAGTAAAGVAWASIPDANGVIHGCYQYTTTNGNYGKLRVFDTAKSGGCNSLEKPLNWNQRGVTGPTGATGSIGPTGPTGAAAPGQTAPFAGKLFNPTGSSHYWLAYGAGGLNDTYHSNGTQIHWLGPMSAAGTTGNLMVDLAGDSPGVGNSFKFTITVSGNNTAVTCTIADLQTSCSDTTDTASYTAGQYLGINFTAPTAASDSSPFVSASLSAG